MRRHLLALEERAGRPDVEPSLLDELFRSFHTLKGISAMVDLSEAEQLAHHMESYLRALRQKEARLGEEGVETLMAATTVLERSSPHAARARRPRPSMRPSHDFRRWSRKPRRPPTSLRPCGPAAERQLLSPSGVRPGHRPRESLGEARTWRFEFAPTPALSERGVNVNSVRARLQEIGEILQATPHVREQGGIVFEFVVATGVEESVFAGWHEDDLTYTPVEEAAAVGTQPPTTGRGSRLPLRPKWGTRGGPGDACRVDARALQHCSGRLARSTN